MFEFEIQRNLGEILNTSGQDVKINNSSAKAIVLHKDDDTKLIITTTLLAEGDIVEYQGVRYIVMGETVECKDTYYKALVQKLMV